MEKSKKLIKQIITFIIVLLFGISLHTLSSATYEVFGGDPGADNKGYEVHMEEGHWTYCIQHRAGYIATYTREMAEKYPVGSETKIYCNKGPSGVKPWADNEYYTMVYNKVGNISAEANQDVAYILYKEGPTNQANKDIWSTNLNEGEHVPATSAIAYQANQYKNFYANIHENGQDVFQKKTKDKTDYKNIKVGVNYNTQEYTVGPFEIEFPNGTGGRGRNSANMFSWVNSVTATLLLENGEYKEIKGKELEILDENGKAITDYGRDGKESLNKTKFYLKFKNDKVIKVGLKVDYGYIESYSANMSKYEGIRYSWKWRLEWLGECSHTYHGTLHENHDYWVNDGYWEEDDDGNETWVDTSHTVHRPCFHYKHGTEYKYVLEKVPEIATQVVLHVETTVDANGKLKLKVAENVKTGTLGGEKETLVDLRMELAGYMFLDQDQGKVNKGNNILEKNEGLPNTDVWVYGVDKDGKQQYFQVFITNDKGYYTTGKKLNSMLKYYVQFNYNGMLYETVDYKMTEYKYNTSQWNQTSKAKEYKRSEFNERFAEIGSYPANYTSQFGGYNKVFLQEEIADTFKALSKAVVKTKGDVKAAVAMLGNTEEAKFAADCRMSAFTDRDKVTVPGADTGKVYPVWTNTPFTVNEVTKPITIAGQTCMPIYEGQRYINCGIKARSTVDLALYKDVEKAEVTINGKTETYKYDARKGGNKFAVGISESDYLNGLRTQYLKGTAFTNKQVTRKVETDSYDINMRSEEVYNGVSTNNYTGVQNYKLNENYTLSNEDRLAVKVTYKIALKNQSSTPSAITEIVDYYDNNFKFNRAYTIKDGKEVNNINASKTSKFGKNTEYDGKAYKTVYLTPTSENELRLNSNGEEQYVYIEFQLLGKTENDAGSLLSKYEELSLLNIAEINGYKTYTSKTSNKAIGLIDIDSNPGNLNISGIDNLQNIATYVKKNNIRYEDDTNRAPALVYKRYTSRTIEGTVFEDMTGKDSSVYTAQVREGNGQLDSNEKGIKGVKVELIEIKDNKMVVRSTTTTNDRGWYGFTGFLPGNYTIRYTYGHNDETAMTKTSQYITGANDKSYNGQDYQSTIFGVKADGAMTSAQYTTDTNLISTYQANHNNKDQQETTVPITSSTVIDKYKPEYYWYTQDDKKSDARDDAYRKSQVIAYSKTEYGTEIVNHKAEVFNAYVNPQPEHIQNADTNRKLANELERRTYRYAYTPEIEIEVEYATKNTSGTKKTTEYAHKITGVDLGIVERPKSELTIDQDIKNIKVTSADDSTVLFDTQTATNNLQWINHGDINKYDKKELLNIIMDEELINGAKLEVTYNITVKNNSERDVDSRTRAKTILNYVSNNLTYDEIDNKDSAGRALWKVVKTSDVQKEAYATYVNNSNGKNYNTDKLKLLDLSTQSVILQATETNPLASTSLAPGGQVTATLTLKKVLSTESSTDDLKYTNLTEIVEIDNTVGRYDHGAVPGNQSVELQPQEHDTSGASQYADMTNQTTPQDGTIIVTPPTGSKYIYYVIGVTSALILAVGIYVIKKYVIKK